MAELTDTIIQQAINAAKAGNKEAARIALSKAIREEPSNARAWYLLSQVIEDKKKVIYCLEKVLELLPDNQQAEKRLSQLLPQTNIPSNQQAQIRQIQIQTSKNQPLVITTEKPIISPSINIPTKKCPYCARTINAENKYCSYCGNDLSVSNQQEIHKPRPKKSTPLTCLIILGALIFLVICPYSVYVVLNNLAINQGDISKGSVRSEPSISFTETDALKVVQNWKPKNNNPKGWTCQETFETIIYFYRNNLDIYDAKVEWSATKLDEQNYLVYARLKGETGWANYSWKLSLPSMKITTSDSMTLCAPN